MQLIAVICDGSMVPFLVTVGVGVVAAVVVWPASVAKRIAIDNKTAAAIKHCRRSPARTFGTHTHSKRQNQSIATVAAAAAGMT